MIDLIFCQKCRRHWERGYFDEPNYDNQKIKWYKILKDNNKSLKIMIIPSGDCPNCDIKSWVNHRNIDSESLPYLEVGDGQITMYNRTGIE